MCQRKGILRVFENKIVRIKGVLVHEIFILFLLMKNKTVIFVQHLLYQVHTLNILSV